MSGLPGLSRMSLHYMFCACNGNMQRCTGPMHLRGMHQETTNAGPPVRMLGASATRCHTHTHTHTHNSSKIRTDIMEEARRVCLQVSRETALGPFLPQQLPVMHNPNGLSQMPGSLLLSLSVTLCELCVPCRAYITPYTCRVLP